MDDINVPIFSQAKLEYTKQLVDILYMNIYDGVRSIYDDAKVVYVKKRVPIVTLFRSLLEQVPKWNSEIIQKETDRIEKSSKCDWLDELLTAVFISHTRILMSIGSNHNFNKINVTIPKTTTFIHKSYINIAREVWKNPYLFDDNIPGHEYQRNMKQLEDMIKLTIEDTIRRQLPIKEILREHLENANEPKQPQNQLDMKTLVDEIRKATSQVNNDTNNDTNNETNYDSNYETDDEEKVERNTNNFSSIFNKEEEEDVELSTFNNSQTNTHNTIENTITGQSIDAIPDNTYVTPDTSPFRDSEDPDEDQIKKATQNIVLNDITEPVVEPSYDNTDIVSPTKSDNNDNKLENMVKELSMDKRLTPSLAPTVKIDKLGDSNSSSSTNNSNTNNSNTNILATVVKKEGDVKTPSTNPGSPKPEPVKSALTSPFSFDNLYSGIKGEGKVEEVKDTNQNTVTKSNETIVIKDPLTPPSIISTNADVMKEVISIDKKEEQIDDTKSLDIFFSDIQKMANPSLNPMEPIKEETKYTLFEDACDKE
uniref:Uncharacterized protein n=1 Tax=viral metagenome TaxID=1070528 RepID=A0A6C0CG92_9ZZZZ